MKAHLTFFLLLSMTGCSGPPTMLATTWPNATAHWGVGSGKSISSLATTSSNEGGAVVYVESDMSTRRHVKLQRLNAEGTAIEPIVELGDVDTTFAVLPVTVAASESLYIACWAMLERIDCASVPTDRGDARSIVSIAGTSPQIVHGPAGWALAFTDDGNAIVQALANEGTPTNVRHAAPSSTITRIAAMPDGFVMTSHGSDIALALSKPYGAFLFVVRDGGVTKREVDGGGKSGADVRLASSGNDFVAIWAGRDTIPGVFTTRIEDGAPPRQLEDAAAVDVISTGDRLLLVDQTFGGEIIVSAMK
jgi:hypothetical protein